MTGTSPTLHPWFGRLGALLAMFPGLIMHRSVTRNYGMTGGYLECLFWTDANGEPTGLTASWRRSER
jgi:hypothetical protein